MFGNYFGRSYYGSSYWGFKFLGDIKKQLISFTLYIAKAVGFNVKL